MVESSKPTAKDADSDYPFEKLQDPCGDRHMKDVARPPRYPLTYEQMFTVEKGT